MARYASGHKNEAKARILAAIGRGFRKHGYGGVGVDGLAKEAEVTSGAFYGHFSSKEEAFKQTLAAGLENLVLSVRKFQAEHGPNWAEAYIDFYLGERLTCDLAASCAMQSLTPEVLRSSGEVKALFASKIDLVARAIAEGLAPGSEAERLKRAWALMVLLSGGVTMARAAEDPALVETMIAGVRGAALHLVRS